MTRTILALVFVVVGAVSVQAEGRQALPRVQAAESQWRFSEPTGVCCKVCRKGKACGDSCIARDKECRQPPGCACDG